MTVLALLQIESYVIESVADATLLSLIVAPLTYLLLTRPLMSSLKMLKSHEAEMTRYMETIEIANQAFEHQAAHLAKLVEEIDAERLRIEHIALHDGLTGLPNRILFRDRLEQSLAQAKREKTGLAVLYLDLNKFKSINDTMGHDKGDELLKEVSLRLTNTIRDVDTAARLGGDEFAVIVRVASQADRSKALKLAERIKAALTIPVEFDGQVIEAGVSIGISLFPGCDNGADLVKRADAAMFQGKREGAGRIMVWDDGNTEPPAT